MSKSILKPLLTGSLTASMMLGSVTAFAQSGPSVAVARPPQFVMLAFDGSRENLMWDMTRQFSKDMVAQGKPLHFTYFISGVYWLTDKNKMMYKSPHHAQGHSNIGFGDDTAKLTQRIQETNLAYEEGNEIGSHANGHYDASDFDHRKTSAYAPWSLGDWNDEFKQFFDLVFNVFRNNNIPSNPKYQHGYAFDQSEIKGFRAPLLGVTDGLWPSLAGNGFKYDTSKVNYTNYWPTRNSNGTWQFPLAEVRIAGTGKKTLSMDYNFYYTQSKGVKDEAHKELYKKQMYETYMNYFNSNYYGNRAPVSIGHHFSRWNGGAYWEAMQDFAKSVCGKPEVKCVTYTEYMNWLESQEQQGKIASYRKGQFTKLTANTTELARVSRPVDVDVDLVLDNDTLEAVVSGTDSRAKGLVVKMSVDGQMFNANNLNLEDIRQSKDEGQQVEVAAHVYNSKGVEVNSSTHVINDIGTSDEAISVEPWEARALRGDMPQAHRDDENSDYQDQ